MRKAARVRGVGLALAAALAAAASAGPAAVAVLVVAPSGGDFASVQAALDAAQAGDTVRVRAGTCRETVVFRRGAALRLPPLPLAQDPRVTVQLHASTGTCWATTHAAPARRNDEERFRDRSD